MIKEILIFVKIFVVVIIVSVAALLFTAYICQTLECQFAAIKGYPLVWSENYLGGCAAKIEINGEDRVVSIAEYESLIRTEN